MIYLDAYLIDHRCCRWKFLVERTEAFPDRRLQSPEQRYSQNCFALTCPKSPAGGSVRCPIDIGGYWGLGLEMVPF